MTEIPDHFLSAAVGRAALPREVMSRHQRERVLAAVTQVFAKRGYQQTTVDNLVAAGKVSVGSFYELFDGKEDCFLAAYDRVLAEARTQIAAAIAAAGDWAEEAYFALGALIELYLAEPWGARLVLVEAQSAGLNATARYNQAMDAATAWLRRGHASYPGAAQLPPSFERTAVAGLAFYLQQYLLDAERHSPEVLLSEISGLVLEPIVGPAELKRLRRQLSASPRI